MKITVMHLSIILFLSISVLCISFGEQKVEWKGKIEKRDGITVIKNPKEPIYDEDVLGLEEELSIGEAKGREDYMFSMIVSIDVDDEGNIYVLDHCCPIKLKIKIFVLISLKLHQLKSQFQFKSITEIISLSIYISAFYKKY